MKLILSRKGFDAGYGGCASPIFEDGSFLSLPIPEPTAHLRFSDLCPAARVGTIVEDLTSRWKNPVRASDHIHLDPDLKKDLRRRKPGWRPLFGQAGSPQGHLDKHSVGEGDIFLFFGWFREVDERHDGKFRFKPCAPDIHLCYGWLKVGEVWRLEEDAHRIPDWAREHPHVNPPAKENYPSNTIYVAAGTESIYDGGTFRSISDELILTEPDQTRSRWRLPKWFHPEGKKSGLSCQDNLSRWRLDESYAYLQTVRGLQEFVLDTDDYPEAMDWANGLIAHHGA